MKVKNIKLYYLLLVSIAILIFSCRETKKENKTAETITTSSEATSSQQKSIPDKNIVVGEWTRTDASYEIKITELLNDGTMKAGYFNPKSINVGTAMWAFADGGLKIYIELRDENYPGSNYNLIYYPDRDLLAGKYFQAVERVTYDVGFTRKK